MKKIRYSNASNRHYYISVRQDIKVKFAQRQHEFNQFWTLCDIKALRA